MGGKSKKSEYGANLEFRNFTKELFDWDTEDDLDGLIDPDPVSHPELSNELPGMILEEDTPCSVNKLETQRLVPNAVSAAAASASKIFITNNTGVCDNSDTPNPILHQSNQHLIWNLMTNIRT